MIMKEKIIKKIENLGFEVLYILKINEKIKDDYDYVIVTNDEMMLDDERIVDVYEWQYENNIRMMIFSIKNIKDVDGLLSELESEGFERI